MGKTRDLFKKIRDTKGTFPAKMGSIKDRNGMDLTIAFISHASKVMLKTSNRQPNFTPKITGKGKKNKNTELVEGSKS